MALKFLNKKGWHTGSLRNIENVWKAEQKHDAEQKKLDELRKQIQEERERAEFRLLQEQAGLVPRQERLDFLYESGLAVGKGSSDGAFKALEAPPLAPSAPAQAAAESSSAKAAVPGALFEDKPQSANDAWRKLHSDPLLLIRQREQEALARIKNNPIQMAMIRKNVETEKKQKKDKKEKRDEKHKRKHSHSKSKNEKQPDSETSEDEDRRKRTRPTFGQREHSKGKYPKHSSKDADEDDEERRYTDDVISEHGKHTNSKHKRHSSKIRSVSKYTSESEEERKRKSDHSYRSVSEHHRYIHSNHENHSSKLGENEERRKSDSSTYEGHRPSSIHSLKVNHRETQTENQREGSGNNRRRGVPKMTEEERAARLREMQLNAEVHEEQRWKRMKKASEADAKEAMRASSYGGKNFLDDAQKSIYGAEKGGSSTIEESIRRRAYYSQGGTASHESNAFRR